MKILYLTSRLPIPPIVKGDTLRDYHIIRELLSRGHNITLVSFYRDGENRNPELIELGNNCLDVRLVKFDIKRQSLKLFKGIISLTPFQVLVYRSRKFQREIDSLLYQGGFDVAYVHFARLAEYLNGYKIPKIIDFQDSFEMNMRDRYFKEKNLLIKLVALVESFKMRIYEARVAQQYNYITVVSERDKNRNYKNMSVVSNGVQNIKFIQKRKNKESNGLLFMGNMTYFPNKDAALFLIEEVMPIISKKIPNLKLYIVGYLPDRKIKKYNSHNICITGYVPDMYPYLVKSRIAVAPLRYGTGMQNKVLDGMVAGIPQIISKKAASGFSNLDGEEFLISECEKQEFSDKILKLWNDFELQDRLVENGKKYVMAHYSWAKSVSILENLFLNAAIQFDSSIEDSQH